MEIVGDIPLSTLFPALLFLLLITCIAYLVYSGLVTPIDVTTKAPLFGDLVIAYKTGKGSYKNAGDIFTDAFLHLPSRMTLGIYYDDPESVPNDELRYAVGSILSEGPDESPDPREMELMMKSGYKIATMPKPNYAVIAEFPFRTTLSIYLAIFRVYPKLKEYISNNSLCAYPAVEIYTSNAIHFSMPLSRQEEWFVPEFSGEEVSIATTEMSTDSRSQQARLQDTKSDDNENNDEDTQVFAKPQIPLVKIRKPSRTKSGLEPDQGEEEEDKTDSGTTSEFEDLTAESEKNK